LNLILQLFHLADPKTSPPAPFLQGDGAGERLRRGMGGLGLIAFG